MNEPTSGPRCVTSLPELVQRARALSMRGSRVLLGITGAPGAGKSTLAEAIVGQVGDTARLVGMDGFHLSQSRLTELGTIARKGAVDTFDAAGFVTLVRRLRHPDEEIIYAPEFRRELEEPIGGALAIEPDVRLVVVEGNYLLVPDRPWGKLRELFDEVWYCEPDEQIRIASLIARHRAYGKTNDEARRWALGSDQRNTEMIAKTRPRADIIVKLDSQLDMHALKEPSRSRDDRTTAPAREILAPINPTGRADA